MKETEEEKVEKRKAALSLLVPSDSGLVEFLERNSRNWFHTVPFCLKGKQRGEKTPEVNRKLPSSETFF